MIEKFLKAKHWQLFLLLFALPFIIYIGWLVSFFSDFITEIEYNSNEFPAEMFDGIMYMLVLMLIPMFVQLGWFYSMAIGLQKKLPEGMTMKVNLFKVFFIIPIIFTLFYFLFLSMLFGNFERIEDLEYLGDSEIGLMIAGIFFFILLSLFVSFCTFYQYWFIAKTIKSAELQKEATFSEFVGEFFLVWFYAIGVWILQPMANKLMNSDDQALEEKKLEG